MIYKILHHEKSYVTEGIEVNKNVISVTIGIFQIKDLSFNHLSVTSAMIY